MSPSKQGESALTPFYTSTRYARVNALLSMLEVDVRRKFIPLSDAQFDSVNEIDLAVCDIAIMILQDHRALVTADQVEKGVSHA